MSQTLGLSCVIIGGGLSENNNDIKANKESYYLTNDVSCRHQIKDDTRRVVKYPFAILKEALAI